MKSQTMTFPTLEINSIICKDMTKCENTYETWKG